MNQYLSKITGEIVGAFQLTKGIIEADKIAGLSYDAVEGDYMIVRGGGNNKEVSKGNFELNFIKIK